MKIVLTAAVKSVGPIEPTKKANGFFQRVVIEQPQRTDEYNRITQHAQIFQIELFDKERSAKFLGAEAVGQVKTFNLWLKGEMSEDKNTGKIYYFVKLKAL